MKGRGSQYKIGTLANVALTTGYFTYEDSSAITKSLCRDMATNIIMKKDIVLGKNSNIEFIVKKGDKVEVGDPLLIFDNSYDDEGLNKLLATMDSKVSDEIKKLGKQPVKSKYSGIIEDIKVYYTVDKTEMSDSLKKTIDTINKPIIQARKQISKHVENVESSVIFHSTEPIKTEDGKVKGTFIGEGIMIEFYIKIEDIFNVGDKLAFFAALKSVTCDVIPEGLEPYTVVDGKKGKQVDAFLAPASVLKRMVSSILDTGYTNKILIGLKDKVKEEFYR